MLGTIELGTVQGQRRAVDPGANSWTAVRRSETGLRRCSFSRGSPILGLSGRWRAEDGAGRKGSMMRCHVDTLRSCRPGAAIVLRRYRSIPKRAPPAGPTRHNIAQRSLGFLEIISEHAGSIKDGVHSSSNAISLQPVCFELVAIGRRRREPTPRRRKTATGTRQDGAPSALGADHNQPIKPVHPLHIDEPRTTG